MMRWYDYVLAVLLADLIQSFFFAAMFATTWWGPMVYGLIAGMLWQAWSTDYCAFRLRQEMKK